VAGILFVSLACGGSAKASARGEVVPVPAE
jgi:hypothetical protein